MPTLNPTSIYFALYWYESKMIKIVESESYKEVNFTVRLRINDLSLSNQNT